MAVEAKLKAADKQVEQLRADVQATELELASVEDRADEQRRRLADDLADARGQLDKLQRSLRSRRRYRRSRVSTTP